VKRFGERLVPKRYEHFKPMSYADPLAIEKQLFERLRGEDIRYLEGTEATSSG
jgi:hypothetical protein